MQMFQTVISCSFLVKVVNKASLTTVLDLQFVSWKLSLIPFPMLWRITSQSLRASKFHLVRVKQTATNAPVIEGMNHMANVSMPTANASFRNGTFSSCNIQRNVQVLFGLPTRSNSLDCWISNREWFS